MEPASADRPFHGELPKPCLHVLNRGFQNGLWAEASADHEPPPLDKDPHRFYRFVRDFEYFILILAYLEHPRERIKGREASQAH